MRNGNTHGFAVEVGTWTFNAGDTNTVTLSTAGTKGKVIADAVAFVKVPDNTASSLTFRHPLNSDLAENVTYACEWSTDLADWRSSGQLNNGGARVTVVSYPPDPNGMVPVVLMINEGPVQALFGRLSARQTP